jgi:RHS repeat-associated protein
MKFSGARFPLWRGKKGGGLCKWHHAYKYDADNRITEVYTSTQTPIIPINAPAQFVSNEIDQNNTDWNLEAKYFYYDHGPLARTELGNQLQGLDYIYNLQGWLKGINATSLNTANDPGGDGVGLFSKDVMAFSLHYYDGDYTPIGGAAITPAHGINYTNTTLSTGVGNDLNLYNGNIRFMQTTLTDIPTGDALPMLNAYKYDQLNRLLEARSYETGLTNNEWAPTAYNNEYRNTFTYDANGNILTQNRHLRDGSQTDQLTYNYLLDGGNLLRNRLYHVNDAIAGATYTGDLEDQGAFNFQDANGYNDYMVENNNNYRYDEEGRLIQDLAEGIQEIVWRVDGKVKAVIFTTASNKNNLEFDYDAFGRRIAKHVYLQNNDLVRSTYYVLDAQSNQLNTYEHGGNTAENQTNSFQLAERVMYGSSRLGINVEKVNLFGNSQENVISLSLGNKLFEMSNHLGNVLTVINDIKVPYDNNGDVAYYATIVSTADYSPFGVQLDGRTESAETYRYGFNGQEKDDEVYGAGNSTTAEFWQYDSRLGRRWNRDPVFKEFESPYAAFANNPIWFRDPNGADTVNFKNAMIQSGSGVASQECLQNSPEFLRFFNEFTTDDGKYKDIRLEFKAENLTTDESSAAGTVYLTYKGKKLTEEQLNAYKKNDFKSISSEAEISDFAIVCVINTRREETPNETIAYKTITLIHEMTVHVYNHAEILVANRNESNPSLVNGKAVCSASMERLNASKNGQDHDELWSGKNILYNQCREEIENASDRIQRLVKRTYYDEYGRKRVAQILYGKIIRDMFNDDSSAP